MFGPENLSDAERALLLELLESERDELPVEIRHTGKSSMREELHERARLVQGLIERMREPVKV